MVEVICNECKEEVKRENLIKYTGSGGYRKLCRLCRNKISKLNSRRRAEAMKMWKNW